MNGGKKLLEKLMAEKSLLEFTKQAWKIIEPGVEFSANWHIEYLAEELTLMSLHYIAGDKLDISPERVLDHIENDLNTRICINIPTRAMKTLLASVFFPVWAWIHNPAIKFIVVSYSGDLSLDINKKRREILKSDWFLENWGDYVILKKEQDAKGFFENEAQGMMFSTSIGGTLTGKGGDIIILDDLQNPKQAESESERKKAINFLTQTLPTRLNDFNKGVIVNIQQRLHVNDVSGFIKENYPFYKFIIVPIEAIEDRIFTYPISGKVHEYKVGEVLWPERMGPDWVKQLKIELGSITFSAQQQQNPTPTSGNIIDGDDFKNWHVLPLDSFNTEDLRSRLKKYWIVISWDLNFKEGNKTDNVAYTVGLTNGVNTYIIGAKEENIGITKTIVAVQNVEAYWYEELRERGINIPIEIVVEDKANGPAVIELLSDAVPGIIPFNPLASKEARMVAVSPFVEAGNVWIPATDTSKQKTENHWAEDFKVQICGFPHLKHDDMADSFSQLLDRIYLQRRKKRKRIRIF
jgi:predicted phage terminase large subunit-like protein